MIQEHIWMLIRLEMTFLLEESEDDIQQFKSVTRLMTLCEIYLNTFDEDIDDPNIPISMN